jgi:SAM-dependent methyltransferase
MSFKDHFSGHAESYARARPTYPEALFDWLVELAPSRALAWDAGTGNGQAARSLAARFEQVHATDASAAQIDHARPHPRVRFAVEPAERSSLESASVDLALVAQALHWFDVEAYFAEVSRVLREGGVFAAITYAHAHVSREIDALVDRLYGEVLGPYWPKERALVESGYADIEFPFDEVDEVPAFDMRAELDLDSLLAYLRSWSATQRHASATASDAVAAFEPALARAWGPRERTRTVRWPLTVRCRIKGPS